MLQNNVLIVPNKRVAESVITNYDMPERRMALLIPVGVAYGSDPDHVERVLVDEALLAAGEVAGLLAEPPPLARLTGFGASSLDFTLICQVASFVDQYPVQHALRKRIVRRFRAEGIEIPFPVRTIEMRGAPAATPAGPAPT
jgi:small-conductance mechanosensitive channel